MELNKNYFTIREAVKLTGVASHTIRYWEKKTNLIKPIRIGSGHRRYTKKDIENILLIKDLIYLKGLSLKGINKRLKSKATLEKNEQKDLKNDKYIKLLKKINLEIKDIIQKIK
jgi:DNA-binding transcriptional MerR regulator